jgi:hypothetical protein
VWGHLGYLRDSFSIRVEKVVYYRKWSHVLKLRNSYLHLISNSRVISAHAYNVLKFQFPRDLLGLINYRCTYLIQNSFTFVLKMVCHILLTYELWQISRVNKQLRVVIETILFKKYIHFCTLINDALMLCEIQCCWGVFHQYIKFSKR